MNVKSDQLKSAESSQGSKSETRNDLTSISMVELQKILASSADGLSQDEAQKRLNQYGLNEIEEK